MTTPAEPSNHFTKPKAGTANQAIEMFLRRQLRSHFLSERERLDTGESFPKLL